MKYFVIAGERSGDLHAGNLVKALMSRDSNAVFLGYGGEVMEAAGVQLLQHYRDLAFMGFWEVITNLHRIKKYLKNCKEQIVEHKPDVVILVDYGGFNMKIAKFCKKNSIRNFYYISPKVWAWNQNRAYKLKKSVDEMFVILPFEKEFFKKFDWDVHYVGNPVLDAVKQYEPSAKSLPDSYVVLLPGSRKQELHHSLPVMVELAEIKADQSFVVVAVDNLPEELYAAIKNLPNVELYHGNSYDVLARAKAAVVTSGTATLETAMWKVPQVVVYSTSTFSYTIARRLIKVPYISLVNLVADAEVVKELIQRDFNVENVNAELQLLLTNDQYRNKMIAGYDHVISLLNQGNASANAAEKMISLLTTGTKQP